MLASTTSGRARFVINLDMQLSVSGKNLVKLEATSVIVSIDARTPCLDHRMMELAFRSSSNTKLSIQGDKENWFKKPATPLAGSVRELRALLQ